MSLAENFTWPHKVAHAASVGRWLVSPHLAYLSGKLRDVASGKIKRLMVFMPPRHGKSELVSKWFPGWLLNMRPDSRIIFVSYEASFAAHWGRQSQEAWGRVRDLVGSGLALESDRAEWWKISGHDGYFTTAGVGGPITGKGMEIGIIDDPIKNAEEAYSETRREAIWDWYQSTFLTRLEPGGGIVLMTTRWHADDLAGRLLKREPDQWEVVSLPALAEDNDPIGRKPGEALWPERYPVEVLERIREGSARWWAALYQQRPLVAEGSVADRRWFGVVDAIPPGAQTAARGWDLAATAKTSADYLCGSKIIRVGNQFIVADVARSRVGPADVINQIQSVAAQDGPGVKIGIEQEPGSSGKITYSHIAGLLAGHRVQPLLPSGDKVFRSMPFLDQCRAGNVKLLRGPWNDAFFQEAESFPVGEHDDIMDSCSYAFGMVSGPQWVGISLP